MAFDCEKMYVFFLKLASLLEGENSTRRRQSGVTGGAWGLGKQRLCPVLCVFQASVFLLRMVYHNIYASVSKRKRKP